MQESIPSIKLEELNENKQEIDKNNSNNGETNLEKKVNKILKKYDDMNRLQNDNH